MVTAADSLTNNSVLIHKFSVKEDEQYEKVEVEEENGEGSAPFEDVDHKKSSFLSTFMLLLIIVAISFAMGIRLLCTFS